MKYDYIYPIFKLDEKTKMLHLWDGPRMDRRDAKALLKRRKKGSPKDKFFIVRWEHYYDKQYDKKEKP